MANGRFVVLDAPRGTFSIQDAALPDPAPGTLRLRMQPSGCCATDAHAYLGQFPSCFPILLGHENVGALEAVGPGDARDYLGLPLERVADAIAAPNADYRVDGREAMKIVIAPHGPVT
jgi:NADPH:quinone reductase-like Zn-dependent oxidoreductase